MADFTRPAAGAGGTMAGTFSTFQRDIRSGKLYSARSAPEIPLILDPVSRRLVPVTSAAPSSIQGEVFPFVLEGLALPRNPFGLPGGPAWGAQGTAELRGTGEGAQFTARVTGLGTLPPGVSLAVWLLHDLVVPPTLDPRDLEALPRAVPESNQPGAWFTLDGQGPTLGRTDVPAWNTVAVPVRVGDLTVQPDGSATLQVPLTPDRNLALDPRALAAGAQAGAAALPSGIVAAILTDAFLRRATVFPHLNVSNLLPQRLAAITQAAVARFDRDGDGRVTPEEVAGVEGAFLAPRDFSRIAVTVEPAARSTPALLPTEAGLVLVGHPYRVGHPGPSGEAP